jgi:hypothetical protein
LIRGLHLAEAAKGQLAQKVPVLRRFSQCVSCACQVKQTIRETGFAVSTFRKLPQHSLMAQDLTKQPRRH